MIMHKDHESFQKSESIADFNSLMVILSQLSTHLVMVIEFLGQSVKYFITFKLLGKGKGAVTFVTTEIPVAVLTKAN